MRASLPLTLLVLAACSAGPEPIRWGTDTCDQCRMVLEDRRFGAELVADRPYKFDGLDELGRFQAARPRKGRIFVTDGETGGLVPAEGATFLASPDLHAPMGGHVMSFARRADAEAYAARHGLKGVSYPGLDVALAGGA